MRRSWYAQKNPRKNCPREQKPPKERFLLKERLEKLPREVEQFFIFLDWPDSTIPHTPKAHTRRELNAQPI